MFGTKNERDIKRLLVVVQQINALEPQMQQLSNEQLRAKTDEFKERVQAKLAALEPDSENPKQFEDEQKRIVQDALDEVLPEAFAVVREGSRRMMDMSHFDVQLIGGMVLHHCQILPMKNC